MAGREPTPETHSGYDDEGVARAREREETK
jgi:hypothetical protein